MRKTVLGLALAALVAAPIAAQNERADLDAIYKIKAEGLGSRSQVMDTLSWLTDVHGPRLTNSPGMKAAAEWTKTRLQEWGMSNVQLAPWGPFGRGWENERLSINMIAPRPFEVLGYPKAWSPGTNGPVTADVVHVTLDTEDDLKTAAGTLKGKIVMMAPARDVALLWDGVASRFTDQQLREMRDLPVAPAGGRGGRAGGPPVTGAVNATRRMAFLVAEGAVAMFEPSAASRSDNGSIIMGAGLPGRDAGAPPAIPQVVLAVEHYNRMARVLAKNVPVQVVLNVQNRFHDDLNSYNVIAEIPGSDKKDEVVMLGAHFDSWHAGTGAVDNASGSAVMMEAMRILKASGLPLRRTVRLGLWTGEEQGLIGSRMYVTEMFGDRATMKTTGAHEKFAGYFNMDNGSGAIRGIYLQGNEAVAPIFEAWMKPFENIGMTTLTIRNTGGTDHGSFDAIGLPGWQFIQDPLDYGTRSHHTNWDVYERAVPADLMKNATIIASFVYHTANRDQLLPRKPMPTPPPAGAGRGGRGGQ
ncbi:MAG: M20/M25/M40 family metallo-hydrolase [Acidobacteriota bacterium]|nr:M20/M25/M40 family metallo-hydrolase [Acidobacteriota bacterium]